MGSGNRIEGLLKDGEVTVNGVVLKRSDRLIDPASDVIKINDIATKLRKPFIYALLHKPDNIVTTMADASGTDAGTINDLIPKAWQGVARPTGRLDKETTGALLITDDGDLQRMLMAPEHQTWKTYHVTTTPLVEANSNPES